MTVGGRGGGEEGGGDLSKQSTQCGGGMVGVGGCPFPLISSGES